MEPSGVVAALIQLIVGTVLGIGQNSSEFLFVLESNGRHRYFLLNVVLSVD